MADTASDNTWYRLRYAFRTLLRKQSSSPPAFAPGLADWLGTNFSIGTAVRSGSLRAGQARIGGENASLASWQFGRNHLDTRASARWRAGAGAEPGRRRGVPSARRGARCFPRRRPEVRPTGARAGAANFRRGETIQSAGYAGRSWRARFEARRAVAGSPGPPESDGRGGPRR